MYDPSSAAMGGSGLHTPMAGDLGDLKASDVDPDSVLGVDDGTSGLGETDATTTPPIGGR